MVKGEKVSSALRPHAIYHILILIVAGGKAKPLKAAKKEKKELDEDDLAFKERQRAGGSANSRANRETNTNE